MLVLVIGISIAMGLPAQSYSGPAQTAATPAAQPTVHNSTLTFTRDVAPGSGKAGGDGRNPEAKIRATSSGAPR
jgi:hypothetical protein